MHRQEFMDSLDQDICPSRLEPCLRALWFDAKCEWEKAHELVQQGEGVMNAWIHAYPHLKEGDDWNAGYRHRRCWVGVPGSNEHERRIEINLAGDCGLTAEGRV